MASPNAKKIRIAGAGPAGLSATILLAKKGYDVEVHEANDTVASRWKRGLQIIENVSETPDVLSKFRAHGIRINFDATPIMRTALWDGKAMRKDFKSREPLGYFVKRGAFEGAIDRGLLDQAKAAGARVIFNSQKSPEDDVDIFAVGPRRIDGMGKELTFETVLSDRLAVILDPKLSPGAFSYLFVADKKATLGMAIMREFNNVDNLFDKVVERFKELEPFDIKHAEVSYSYANFFTKRSLQQNGHLFIGEAAGFQDYLFGFGIRYAVESAILGARSIVEGVSFDEIWKPSLGKRQEVSLWNRFFYEHFESLAPRIFIKGAEKSPNLREYLRGWYSGNIFKLMTTGIIKTFWQKRNIYLKEVKPHVYKELKHQ